MSALLCIRQSYAQSSQVGVPPRGGGAGRRDRGQSGRGESFGKLDNVKYLWYNGSAGLPHN